MGQFNEAVIPLNTLEHNPDLRGSVPLVAQIISINPAAMVAGVIAVDADCVIGKGLGEVLGIVPMQSVVAANEIIGLSVAAHSSDAGKITITINSNDNTSTTNIGAFNVLVFGRILPKDVS